MGLAAVEHHKEIETEDLLRIYEYVREWQESPKLLAVKVQFDMRFFFLRRGMENIHLMDKEFFQLVTKHGAKYVVKRDELQKNHVFDREKFSAFMPEIPGKIESNFIKKKKIIVNQHNVTLCTWTLFRLDHFHSNN